MEASRQAVEGDRTNLDISNIIAAFSEDQVEVVTGLTKRQLRYWAKTGFFKPSFVEDNPRLPYSRFYSFKDLVGLRTLEVLRVKNAVPLQQLRVVAEKLSHLGDDLWSSTTLFVFDRKVVLENSETGTYEEVASGQYLIKMPLRTIVEDTYNDVTTLQKRAPESIGRVDRSRGILRNAWVVAGTRIPVHAIKSFHEHGYSVSQIIGEYPDLTPEDVNAALNHDEPKAA